MDVEEERIKKEKADKEAKEKAENEKFKVFFMKDDKLEDDKNKQLLNLIGKSEIKEYGFIGKKKKKMPGKKKGSAVDDNLQKLYEGKITDWQKASEELKNGTVPMKESEAKFYTELLKSLVYNVKLNIADLLNGRCFKYHFTVNNFLLYSKVFSNDRLYWQTILWNNIQDDPILYQVLKINNKEVNLQTISKYQGKEYKKGYIEEYKSDFSIIGKETLSEEDKKKLEAGNIDGIDCYKGNYKVDGVQYNFRIFKGGCILTYKDGYKGELLKNSINGTRMVSLKKTLVEEIKVMKIAAEQSFYISQNIKTTDFYPCVVIFSNPLDYSFMFNLDVDMLSLSEQLRYLAESNSGEIKDLGSFLHFENLVTWDTFDVLANFLVIENSIKYKEEKYKYIRDVITPFSEDWTNIKREFRLAKKRIEQALKLFVKFYDSFQKRIPYDKMINMQKEIDRIINAMNAFDEEIFNNIHEFLKKHNLLKVCLTIANSVKGRCSLIKETLTLIKDFTDTLNSKTGGQIIYKAKVIGTKIFGFFNISTNDNIMINDIRTPSSFLGNLLTGEEINARAAAEQLDEEKEKKEDKEEKESNLIMLSKKLSNEDAIKYLIFVYLKAMGINNDPKNPKKQYFKIDRDNYKVNFANEVEAWYNGGGDRDKIYDLIQKSGYFNDLVAIGVKLFAGRDDIKAFRKLSIPPGISDLLGTLYENLKTYNNKLDENLKLYINEKEAELARLSNLVGSLKAKQMYLPLKEGDPVTIAFLNKNDIDKYIPENNIQKAQLDYLRKRGITDDVIQMALETGDETMKEILDNERDLVDDIEMDQEYDEKSPDDGLSVLDVYRKETQKLWGENGSLYNSRKNANFLIAEGKKMYSDNKKQLKEQAKKKRKRKVFKIGKKKEEKEKKAEIKEEPKKEEAEKAE